MLKPAALFTDGAVLCRGKEIRVFGEADHRAVITVTLTDSRGALLAEAECTARDGRFLACLRPQEAQTGCCLFFTAGEETVAAEDVSKIGFFTLFPKILRWMLLAPENERIEEELRLFF